jgi:hypothetical protein
LSDTRLARGINNLDLNGYGGHHPIIGSANTTNIQGQSIPGNNLNMYSSSSSVMNYPNMSAENLSQHALYRRETEIERYILLQTPTYFLTLAKIFTLLSKNLLNFFQYLPNCKIYLIIVKSTKSSFKKVNNVKNKIRIIF